MSNKTWSKYSDSRNTLNERNDCAVIAVAELTGCSYEEAHKTLKSLGRKDREGTSNPSILRAIRGLGCKVGDIQYGIDVARDLKRTGMNPRKNLTVNMVEKYDVLPKGKYIAFINGHCLAIIDGEVRDWSAGRKHHINTFYEVTN